MLALTTVKPGNSQFAADSPFAARWPLGLISRSLGASLTASGTAGVHFAPSLALGMTEEVKPVAGGDAGLEAKDGAAKGRKPARNDSSDNATGG